MTIIPERAINFKVTEELYKKIKLRVVNKDTTIKDYIIKLILKDLEEQK